MTAPPLKLRAEDADDLATLAVLLQDAIAPVSEMTFQAEEKRFVMVVHRFRWDEPESADEPPSRVGAAIDVAGVRRVRRKGFGDKPDTMLDLLTLAVEGSVLTFLFAGGATLCCELEPGSSLALCVSDFGDPWAVTCRPSHST
jgi:hypothetical protein